MSLRKNSLIASVAISVSRVAGLVREIAFAYFFGASPVLDAFIAAFRIPNLLRDLFSEGALSASFVSVFSRLRAKKDEAHAWALANRVTGLILLVVGLLTILGIIFSPAVVHLVASGFEGEKHEVTVALNRILFPFILFVSLAALTMGMLNTHGKYALPQSASTFFNVTSVLTGLGLATWMSPEAMMPAWRHLFGRGLPEEVPVTWNAATHAMMGMAWGTFLGGVVQWLIQVPSLYKLGFRYKWNFTLKDPDLRRVIALTIPAVIGGAAVQVNVMINSNFASYLADGSISWLNYAFRFMQFPIGVFGVAVASASAPVLARLVAEEKTDEVRLSLRSSLQMLLYLCVPSALGLFFLAGPIISLIYEHGRFSANDTSQAARALQAYTVGLVFYALIKVYQPAFLAYGKSRAMMFVAFFSIAVNAGLNWIFVFVLHYSHWGLALGTSCVAGFNGIVLALLFRKLLPGVWSREMLVNTLKIFAAAVIAAGAGWMSLRFIWKLVNPDLFGFRLFQVFGPLVVTAGIYFGISLMMGVEEANLMKGWLKRKGRR